MRTYDSKQVAQYLLRWKDYDSEYDKWRSITKLGDCMNLIKNYETKITELSDRHQSRSRKESRLRKSATAAQSSVSKQILSSRLSRLSHQESSSTTRILRNPIVIISSPRELFSTVLRRPIILIPRRGPS